MAQPTPLTPSEMREPVSPKVSFFKSRGTKVAVVPGWIRLTSLPERRKLWEYGYERAGEQCCTQIQWER
jgi:hypothetical protein